MIKHILPNPFLKDFKSKNLNIINNGNELILEPLNEYISYWITFAIDKGFNTVSSDDLKDFELVLEGKFIKDTRLKIDKQDEISLDGITTCYKFPLIFNETTNIKNIDISGTFKEPITIIRLTLQPKDYTQPSIKKNIHFIYEPSNITGIFRKQEKDILDYINITDKIEHDTVVYCRPIAEMVTKDYFNEITLKLDEIKATGKDPRIINDIKNFYNHNIKNFTFDIWKKNNIPITEYQVVKNIEIVHEFVKIHNYCVFRINNQWGGRQTHVINNETSKEVIEKYYNELVKFKQDQLEEGFENVDLIINRKVLPVKYNDKDLILNVGRSYVINGRIINTHAFVHKMNNNNQLTGSVSSIENFIEAHKIILGIERKYKELIIKCITSLGIQVGCLDFLIEDDKPVFLEVNASWGSGLGVVDYPYSQSLKKYLMKNHNTLYEQIPNAYDRTDMYYMWKQFYKEI